MRNPCSVFQSFVLRYAVCSMRLAAVKHRSSTILSYFFCLNSCLSLECMIHSLGYILLLLCRQWPGLTLKMPFYAVARGRKPGVYLDWSSTQDQVSGFRDAKFKKFDDEESALKFISDSNPNAIGCRISGKRKAQDFLIENVNVPNSKRRASLSIEPSSSVSAYVEPKRCLSPNFKNEIDPSSNINVGNEDTSHMCKERIHALEERILTLEERFDALDALKVFTKNESKENAELTTSNADKIGSYVSPVATHSAFPVSNLKKKLLQSVSEPVPVSSTSKSYSTLSRNRTELETSGVKSSFKTEDGRTFPFRLDSENYVMVYTDGACSENGRLKAKAGVGVWFNDGHPLNVSEPVRGRPTNNVAEIEAATRAVERAASAGVKKMCIITDSMFMIKCMTDWVLKWKNNDWKTAEGKEVKNKTQLLDLQSVSKKYDMEIKWTHVQAHRGIHGNEQADALARAGAQQYKPVNIPSVF